MLDLMLMDKIQARPPPPQELVKAWRTFFAYKDKKGEAVNRIQAEHVLRTLLYLQKNGTEEEDSALSEDDLKLARKVFLVMPIDKVDVHNEMARELYKHFARRHLEEHNEENSHVDLKFLVHALTLTGDSVEAREITEKFWDKNSETMRARKNMRSTGRKFWQYVLMGFAKENNEAGLLRTAEMAEAAGMPYSMDFHRIMTTFFAERNDVEATKKWYGKAIDDGHLNYGRNPETLAAVLRFCIRHGELDWSKTVFRDILETNPSKVIWDVVLQWAAGAMGKGVEDVERMMEIMSRRNPNDDSVRPDVETINGLVDLAMSLKDPYLAERYIALGLKSGIRPNARTFILQMNYRADAGDLTGAQVAYEALQAEEIINDEDLPAINKYIRALCAGKGNNYDRIVSIASEMEERNVRLEAETVSGLSMMYLRRGELPEAIDLLQTHVYHYTLAERTLIRDAFLSYCRDSHNSTLQVWDAYTIMRQMFDETPTEVRTQIMNEFFRRKRCDMACHVFGHMRQHIRTEKRPVLNTYIQCFEGIARCEDREHLDMVHNMLKMDSSIEPSTRLYNSLMLAYTACEDADRALDFWDDITNSTEGPSYRSLEIVFGACQRKPFGDRLAREIWGKMKRMEIEVTREVWVAFVGALAGQGKLEECKGLVEGMEAELRLKVDALT